MMLYSETTPCSPSVPVHLDVAFLDTSRATTAVYGANDVDIFYRRRLDPHEDDCCGMCTQVRLVVVLRSLVCAGEVSRCPGRSSMG